MDVAANDIGWSYLLEIHFRLERLEFAGCMQRPWIFRLYSFVIIINVTSTYISKYIRVYHFLCLSSTRRQNMNAKKFRTRHNERMDFRMRLKVYDNTD